MSAEQFEPVTVSRRIGARASDIFDVLANPCRHIDLDGSGMLRRPVTDAMVTRVGDVFVMRMYYSEHGDYEMNHVVDYEVNRRIGWEPVTGRGGHPDEFSGQARWGHRWSFELVEDGPARDDRDRGLRLLGGSGRRA